MLRCVIQRATNLERGERHSDPLASITFRGKRPENLRNPGGPEILWWFLKTSMTCNKCCYIAV